jgi:putative transposase
VTNKGRVIKRLQNLELSYYSTYLNYNFSIRRMIYTTNWIERLNRDYRRVLKIRGAMPNVESVLALLSKVSIDRENNLFKYPINNFKFELKLKKIKSGEES